MKFLKKLIKRPIALLLDWLEVPGSLYFSERYKYVDGIRVFPGRNASLITRGKGVSVHDAIFNVWAPISLEDFSSIAHGCILATGGHEISKDGVTEKVVPRGPIHIKEGAFIGSGSLILGGVTIGRGSIVAAGSVVTKSIPDHEIWGGCPAKLIKRI
jgi:maltose O-acetyltransferase